MQFGGPRRGLRAIRANAPGAGEAGAPSLIPPGRPAAPAATID